MRMYLDYAGYATLGGELEPEIFERLDAKAEAMIDRATHRRLRAEAEISMSVKYCIMELIAALQADSSMGAVASGREILSMSNDGVSMSFASAGAQARFTEIMRQWLSEERTAAGVPLLYAGVDA